jgi:hypothetical protein
VNEGSLIPLHCREAMLKLITSAPRLFVME